MTDQIVDKITIGIPGPAVDVSPEMIAAALTQSDPGFVRTDDKRLPSVTPDVAAPAAPQMAWRVSDSLGRTPLGVDVEGVTHAAGGIALSLDAAPELVGVSRGTGVVWGVAGQDSRAVVLTHADGTTDLLPAPALLDRIRDGLGDVPRSDPRVAGGWDIIIGAGQSNMHGPGDQWDASIDITLDGLDQWDCTSSSSTFDTAIPAVESLHAYEVWGVRRTSPLTEMGRQMWVRTPASRRVVIVPAALGATDMAGRWNPDNGDLFAWMLARVGAVLAAAPPSSRVRAFVWGQGEGDSTNTTLTTKAYQGFLERIWGAICDLAGGQVPFIVNGMVPEWWPGQVNGPAIDAALRGAAASTPLGRFVEGPAGMNHEGGIHFTSAGGRILGRKDFAALTAIEVENGVI